MQTKKIDNNYWENTKKAYLSWVKLNESLEAIESRKANFPSGISESVVGHVYGYEIILGEAGDLYDPINNKVIEVKATSNYDRDLSSFSPSEFYDNLIFVRYDERNKNFNIYNLDRSRNEIDKIPVNKTETYKDHREQGRRPRFSIIKQIIDKENLAPDKVFSIEEGSVRP